MAILEVKAVFSASVQEVTVFEPCVRWEFDMKNSNMKGHWTGVFSKKMDRLKLILQKM